MKITNEQPAQGSKETLPVDRHVFDDYNVVWTSQSENSAGSMPCGGEKLVLDFNRIKRAKKQ